MEEIEQSRRLQDLEHRVKVVEVRLEQMQPKFHAMPNQPPKPPPPPWPNVTYSDPKTQVESPSGLDSEEFIGKRVLPAVGAILLLAALGCWTPVAYNRMSPTGSFALELLLSSLFFGVGRLLCNTKAQFGEVVSGIGAGGLLLTLAAGAQYHHLYSGPVMVGLCLGASCLIGFLGMLLNSRTFECIGAVGGLIGAWMPSMQHDLYLSATLQAIIVTATLLVFTQSKWKSRIAILYPFALVAASQFFLADNLDWRWRVLALDLLGLQFALAYALSFNRSKLDPQMAFPVATLAISILGGFAMHADILGSAHVAIFAGLIGILSMIFRQDIKKRAMFQIIALTGAVLLIPFGLHELRISQCLGVFSLLLACAYLWRPSNALGILVIVEVTVGSAIYAVISGIRPLSNLLNFSLNQSSSGVLLLLALVVWSMGASKNPGYRNLAFAVAGSIGWVVVTTTFFCKGMLGGSEWGISALWALWALIELVLGLKLDVKLLRIAGYSLLGLTLLKVLLSDLHELDGTLRAGILLVLGLVMLIGGYAVIRSKPVNGGRGLDEVSIS